MITRTLLHEIPDSVIKCDISLFLEHRFSEIWQEESKRGIKLSFDWPGGNNICVSSYNVGSVVYLCSHYVLHIWRSSMAPCGESKERSSYTGVAIPALMGRTLLIKQSGVKRNKLIEAHRGVIGTIIIHESPLPVASLSRLTGISKESIHVRLELFHSILSIPNDKTKPIRPFHLSFRDFLLHPDTPEKTPLWIDEKEIHQTLAVQCLKVMQHKLRKNICNLPGDGTERGEVGLNSVSHHLSLELHYACRYWAQHLIQSQDPITEMVNAFSFLKLHFLHWVEATGILGIISEVVKIINIL